MADFSLNHLWLALIGGIVPAGIWLCFWLTEDSEKPEPPELLIKTFLGGGLAVALSLLFEYMVGQAFPSREGVAGVLLVIIWASIEEITKFLIALKIALWSRYDDEPIDPLIYMITIALGFSAFENTLFLLQPLSEYGLVAGILNSNMRFIGATLLHVIASGTIGVFMSFAFFKAPARKVLYVVSGLVMAIALHAVFNLAIIDSEKNIIPVFALVWLSAVFLLYMFERVKKIHKN